MDLSQRYCPLWLSCFECKKSQHTFRNGGLFCLHPDRPSGHYVIYPGDLHKGGAGVRCTGYDQTKEHCMFCHAHPCPVKVMTRDGKTNQFCSIEHLNDYRNVGLGRVGDKL